MKKVLTSAKEAATTLVSAIKHGIIRIFPLPKFVLYIFAIVVACTLIGCATPKQVTQLVHDTRVDTVYMTNQLYDSIYIYKDKLTDHRLGTLEPSGTLKPDTLYIKDVSIEYRYRLLRDTIRIVERDSIPYEVTITETKEITRPLT